MAPPDTARHRVGVPLDRVHDRDRHRVVRDPDHRPLPAGALRLQPRGVPLDVAGLLLRLQRPRHRPLPAVHAGRRRGLSGPSRHRLPGAPLARSGPGQELAAGHPALHRRRVLRRWHRHRDRAIRRDGLPLHLLHHRPDHRAGALRRHRAPVRRALPPGNVRRRAGHGPLGHPGRRLRRPDDRRLPAVPARPGRQRASAHPPSR